MCHDATQTVTEALPVITSMPAGIKETNLTYKPLTV